MITVERLYFDHKKLYYSTATNRWDKVSSSSPEVEKPYEDFSFSDHDDNDEYEGIFMVLLLSTI